MEGAPDVTADSGVGEAGGVSGDGEAMCVDVGGGGKEAVALFMIPTGTDARGVLLAVAGGGTVRLTYWAVGVEYFPQRLGAGLQAPRSINNADSKRMARLTADLREDYNGRHMSPIRGINGQNVGALSA